MYNIQHFLFIGGLAQMEIRKKKNSSEIQRLTILHEDIPNAFPRGITHQYKGLVEVKESQNHISSHSLFQILEGMVGYWSPTERIPFKEHYEGSCNFSIILNKLMIISHQTLESTYALLIPTFIYQLGIVSFVVKEHETQDQSLG
jgi:hypothetical protein